MNVKIFGDTNCADLDLLIYSIYPNGKTMQKLSIKSYLLLFSLALCWGPAYLFIKIALQEFHPITLAFFRVSIACMIIFTVCKFKSINVFQYISHYKSFFFMGIFINATPFTLINYGELQISSGLTAINLGMIPVFTALLCHIALPSERLKQRTIFGIFLAFTGLILIYLPTLYDKTVSNGTGPLLILLAAFSYAVAMTFAKKYLGNIPPLVCVFYQLLGASFILFPLALINGHPLSINILSAPFASVLILAIIGTAVAFLILYESVKISGATFTALNSLIIPIISILLGSIFLNEKLTLLTVLGTAMILLGVFRINPYFVKKESI